MVAAGASWSGGGFGIGATPIAIAVLPLENLSHDPASDYFADGLTDELIRNLSLDRRAFAAVADFLVCI